MRYLIVALTAAAAVAFPADSFGQTDRDVHVVLINPAGNLLHMQSSFAGSQVASASALQVVAVFFRRDNTSGPGSFWDEFSGNDAYCLEENASGVGIKVRDVTPSSLRIKQFNAVGNPDPIRAIGNQLADAVMSGACWDTYDGGDYADKLTAARTLVGFGT